MKKTLPLVNLVLVALFFTSCATKKYTPDVAQYAPEKMTYTTTYTTYTESTGRNLEPTTTAINLPLVAEVQVIAKKITYTETESFKNITVTNAMRAYGKEFKTTGIAEYKRIALAKAANAHNADIIIGATFMVETTKDNHLSITVTGYPAVYKNFHTVTKSDADLLRIMDPFMQRTYYDPILNDNTAPIVTNTSTIVQ